MTILSVVGKSSVVLELNIPTSSIVLDLRDPISSVVVASGAQGPKGIDGTSGLFTIDRVPSSPIGGHRVVISSGLTSISYADSDNTSNANMVLGVTTTAVVAGGTVKVQFLGEISEPSWTFIPNELVFCGHNGLLTQIAPTTGFQLIMGVALTPTTVLLAIKQPLILI